jgi:hypothetical protein
MRPGLPDGLFSHQKFQFRYILEGLEMENVGTFYGSLEYVFAIWYIYVCPFGNLVVFRPFFSFLVPRKIFQPLIRRGILFCARRA